MVSPVEEGPGLTNITDDSAIVYDSISKVAAVRICHCRDVEHIGLPWVLRPAYGTPR